MSPVRIRSPAPFLWNKLTRRGVSQHRRLRDDWILAVVHTFHPVLAASPLRVGHVSDSLAPVAAAPPDRNRGKRSSGVSMGDRHIAGARTSPRLARASKLQ
jgi:hypothetical protein